MEHRKVAKHNREDKLLTFVGGGGNTNNFKLYIECNGTSTDFTTRKVIVIRNDLSQIFNFFAFKLNFLFCSLKVKSFSLRM